jgi:hypothetical protein
LRRNGDTLVVPDTGRRLLLSTEQCLARLWGHSREEDGGDITVYRPHGYAFPLSRGRDFIEFGADGTVRYYGSSPDDRTRVVTGDWRKTGEDTFALRRASDAAPLRMTVVQCDAEVLKVRFW